LSEPRRSRNNRSGVRVVAPARALREASVSSVTIQEAQARLTELIRQLTPGEELVIADGDRPVARLVPTVGPEPKLRRLGTLRGTVLHMAADFDEPLDDFRESMD
jgi:antitoxin (DNA-binding transcriptional repressor) of toxin-antitoxin stability system